MRRATYACLLLILAWVFTGFSQEQREAERPRPRNRSDVSRIQERPRDEKKHDAGMRRPEGKRRKMIERERTAVPQESQLVRPQSLQRETPDRLVKPVRDDYRGIFDRIQTGMKSGNVGAFSQHFGSQVLFNLRGGESGYFSASQAYYLLDNYLRSRKLVYFDFSTVGESESNPYATGSAAFNVKGSREITQIYVSLSLVGDRWVISQINIY